MSYDFQTFTGDVTVTSEQFAEMCGGRPWGHQTLAFEFEAGDEIHSHAAVSPNFDAEGVVRFPLSLRTFRSRRPRAQAEAP